MGLSMRDGSEMQKHCCEVLRVATKFLSSSATSTENSGLSATMSGSLALQDVRIWLERSAGSLLRRTLRSCSFCFCRSVTSFCRLSKKNFFLSRVRRARMRFLSLRLSICAWLLDFGRLIVVAAGAETAAAALRFLVVEERDLARAAGAEVVMGAGCGGGWRMGGGNRLPCPG